MPVYLDVIDRLAESDAHFAACVAAGGRASPFRPGTPMWRAHAAVAAQLLVGCINRRELVAVLMDETSTPRGCALNDTVRRMVNNRLWRPSVVSAVCLDLRTSDLLQIANLVPVRSIGAPRLRADDASSPYGQRLHLASQRSLGRFRRRCQRVSQRLRARPGRVAAFGSGKRAVTLW